MIALDKLNYTFHAKPLLIGGKAMGHYQLREAGADVDFVVCPEDYEQLAARYPQGIKELFGDLGVCVHEFEFWKSIVLFDYDFLSCGALEQERIKVISLEKLLFLKALAIADPKYARDVRLIVEKIHAIQYGKDSQYAEKYFHS